ncbi:MAG TPA: hypothetical protein ENJ18_06520 [Nannocystis exedens]|nr:hypothetical protein [Nannocystis exedens]
MLKPRLHRLLWGATPLLVSMLLATNAWASPEEAGHGGHEGGITLFNWPSDADPRIGLVWLLINFAVLLVLIHKLLWRSLVASNHVRHDTIKRELEEATRARETAESVVREFKAKIESFESERQGLLEAARTAAEADRKRIVAEAEDEAAKIVEVATAVAEREADLRRSEVESEIVGKAVERARELLLTTFNDADQRRLVDTYAADVAATSLKGGA